MSIDLKGGAGNVEQRSPAGVRVHYPSSFAGGYGFRLRLYEGDDIKAVFGFQHISVHPRSLHIEEDKNKAVLDDWQTSILISRKFNKINPYAGLKFSRTDYIHWQEDNRKRKMSDLTESVGIIIGIDVSLNSAAWLNLEGQFLDSRAMAASLNFSF
ncbi:MAG: hypothetical protein GF375_06950 [Candidatus Omnitrophica bacterium]|nr:hypothetical protein [Candidatus Omnitrophota bacterium]MBD3269714.1 hypothetical protein [Candidatus Omnitrophota bacterium]